MARWQQQNRRERSLSVPERLKTRERRRADSISAAVRGIVRAGGPEAVHHAEVARATGVPVGYLEWKYPSEAALLATGGKPHQIYSALPPETR